MDIRILVPGRSDIIFMPWVATAFYRPMLSCGIRVFEYHERPLHAKSLIIDDWFSLGSTNLNHRSFMHDLELDVVLAHRSSHDALVRCFLADLEGSHKVTDEHASRHPLAARLFGRLLLSMRRWL